jgi:putative heme-binding domain-containing protein
MNNINLFTQTYTLRYRIRHRLRCMLGVIALGLNWLVSVNPLVAQTLEAELERMPPAELAALAKAEGDAARGAVVFYGAQLACTKCHAIGGAASAALGPDLTALGRNVSDDSLIESVLYPSKVIREGYAPATIVDTQGKSISALVVERSDKQVKFRDVQRPEELVTLAVDDIDEIVMSETSIMPAGQINQLASRQQFLDLLRYLMELRDGGAQRAKELQPPLALIAPALPEYEKHLDHAALIRDWNDQAFQRGEAIYRRVCANCHGTKDQVGSLPTSLRFAEGKFKNGSDPLAMYRTLTHGFGLMPPQTWMVPSQKYDVIHYIREAYLRRHNRGQLVEIDAAYLAQLPPGDTRGPEPSKIEVWSAMDYGPSLTHTYEIPGLKDNFAYKGIAVRLDGGAGGVSRAKHWMVFDTDTLRMAAAWSAPANEKSQNNFINWRGIQFNGEHQIHPTVVGDVALANSIVPGWANPADGSFRDDQRVVGRDGRRYGPLPRAWGKFHGVYYHGQQVILNYSIGDTKILESPRLLNDDTLGVVFLRAFNIGPRRRDLLLQVAENSDASAAIQPQEKSQGAVVTFGAAQPASSEQHEAEREAIVFDGTKYLEVADGDRFDFTSGDFSIAARLKTTSGGTILSVTEGGEKWIPDGQALFVRNGRLCFDIGWVGVISSRAKIDDGKWHDVVAAWNHSERRIRLFVDRRLEAEGQLAAREALPRRVLRIGYAASNFPQPQSLFSGEIAEVRFYQRCLADGTVDFSDPQRDDKTLVARWKLSGAVGEVVEDATGHGHDARVAEGNRVVPAESIELVAGIAPPQVSLQWLVEGRNLRLKIPAGDKPLKFTIWTKADRTEGASDAEPLSSKIVVPDAAADLTALTHGGPPRWPQRLETKSVMGGEDGPLAVDALTMPESNPWLAQMRMTGLDFFADGRVAVCSWDGDVWIVEPLQGGRTLRWQRIASGLFQPLGLKIVDGRIHVTCRDQLAVLHDLNGDGEIDFYQCLNNDHQVTEHFHEFAMGLQADVKGNFYYAKSARHALPAIVPQHGTLLRVSRDGARTDIVANGFRAANGVCLNPDGSFVVTDQEGHWNPKNRINWVTLGDEGKPNFYGNMFGYHDVTDSSDSAMVPPLCWITNALDRSPAELLWVESKNWGPLHGSLLNLSYGYGKVFVVPYENIAGQMQGGMIEIPLPTFPTGLMRGRFNPHDGHLYLCGMCAWGGNATHPGGLFRLRATGKAMHLPVALHATKSGMEVTFTEALDPESIALENIHVKTWSLKRSASYGSKHYDERPAHIRSAELTEDGKTLRLDIPKIAPTWCMEIKYELRSMEGKAVRGVIHNTIHALADDAAPKQ